MSNVRIYSTLAGLAAATIGLTMAALPAVRAPVLPCSVRVCEDLDVVCRITSVSIFVDPDDMDPFPLTIKTPIALSDISMGGGCIPRDVDIALCAVVTDSPAGGPLPTFGYTDPPYTTDNCPPGAGCILLPNGYSSDDVGQLCVTFPEGTLFGEYEIELEIYERNPGGTKGDLISSCEGSVTLSNSITAKALVEDGDLPEMACAEPGDTIERKFRITNHTDEVRTVETVITSRQLTSSQPGDPGGYSDHFSIAECPNDPPPRDSTDTDIPTLMDMLTLAPNSSQDVCIRVRSFEGCTCGSQNEILLEATDVTDGPVDPPAGSIATAAQDYMTNSENGEPCCICSPDQDSTLSFGDSTAGSWGTEPTISVWSQRTGSWVQTGSGYTAVLLNDVGLHQSITQPLLLMGLQRTSDVFGMPVDLTRFGAPGYELLVVPDAILAPNAPNSIHYSEYGTFIGNDPALVGQHIFVQWVLRDPSGNDLGLSLTNAAEVVLTY